MKVYVIGLESEGEGIIEIVHATTDEEKAKLYCALHNVAPLYDHYKIKCLETDDFSVETTEPLSDVGCYYSIWFEGPLDESGINDNWNYSIENSFVTFESPSKILYTDFNKGDNTIEHNIQVWLREEDNNKAIEVAKKLIIECKEETIRSLSDAGYFYSIRFEGDLDESYINNDFFFNIKAKTFEVFEDDSRIVLWEYNRHKNTVDCNAYVWLHEDNDQKAIAVARKLILEYKARMEHLYNELPIMW